MSKSQEYVHVACKFAVHALVIFSVSAALAKLPPPTAEQNAAQVQEKARQEWQGKVDAYAFCKAQDRVAAHYRSGLAKAGKTAPPVVTTPDCSDPGPFTEPKSLEASGAHSPAATAISAPAAKAPQGTALPSTSK